MIVPGWLALALLLGASFRVYRLIAHDTILNRPRKWLVGLGDWKEGDTVPDGYREWLTIWLECPWCCGFWVTVAWWGAFEMWPHGTLVAAAPWAISGAVALVAKHLDADA